MRVSSILAEVVDRLLIKKIYEEYVFKRRISVLAGHLSRLIPEGAQVLDVGCGDGQLTCAVSQSRHDITIEGIDIVMREKTDIPVTVFNGRNFPYRDASFDVVLLIDMLHHTTDQMILLREARRVTRKAIIIKDHLCERFGATAILRAMDWVGNARYHISLTYNYWSKKEWFEAFNSLNLTPKEWITDVKLYPFPANLIFGRALQFIARIDLR
jgi:ubiquinone/menaquinone biosynthesis C-methylase UbiE